MTHHHHSSTDFKKGSREHLKHAIEAAGHYLPTQGPIGVFVHHNTLHAFQHEDFEPSVIKAAELFKAEPFLSEEAYQAERAKGRILDEDIDDVLHREPDAEIIP
ncbi:MAG: Na-translocating system protein MpsB, partial [Prosthecobacter sp.]|nr:Na-translocating system protein MpsB [Prosthecobacter sp.]